MDDRLIGAVLIIIGLIIFGSGGTMSTFVEVIFYISGPFIAFVGLGFLIKHQRKTSIKSEGEEST
ncbi:MAG: hypothetical protein ACFFB5_01530 [Promethearchaeota archaeon]